MYYGKQVWSNIYETYLCIIFFFCKYLEVLLMVKIIPDFF